MGPLSWTAGWAGSEGEKRAQKEKGVSGRASFSHLPASKDKNLPPVGWGWSFSLDKWGFWGGPKSWGTLSSSSATSPSFSIAPYP